MCFLKLLQSFRGSLSIKLNTSLVLEITCFNPYSLIILSQVAYKCPTGTQTCALLSPRLDALPTAINSRLYYACKIP